jgi:hypothetical protein
MTTTQITIYEKMIAVRAELQGKLTKDGINTFFGNSHYATKEGMLRVINPVLGAHGLGLHVTCEAVPDQPTLCAWVLTIYTAKGSGNLVSSIIAPVIHDPQKVGAAMTYFTRYLLEMALGICAQEDDDGNAAQASYTEQERARAYDRTAYTEPEDVHQTPLPLLSLPLALADPWAYEEIKAGPLKGYTWRDVSDADVGIPPVELREILVEGLKGARAERDSETADKIAAVGLALRKHIEATQ